jgi:hypothetical protein
MSYSLLDGLAKMMAAALLFPFTTSGLTATMFHLHYAAVLQISWKAVDK